MADDRHETTRLAGNGGQQNGGAERGPRLALGGLAALVTVGLALHLRWLLSRKDLSYAVDEATRWFQAVAAGHPLAIALVLGPFLALFGLVVALLVYFGLPDKRQSALRSLQLGTLLGACLAAAWFIGTARLDGLRRIDWRFFIPFVPAALVAFQAFVTWRQRPRGVGDFRLGVSRQLLEALKASGDHQQFVEVHRQLLNFFGGVAPEPPKTPVPPAGGRPRGMVREGSVKASSVATEFALPGLLLLLVGFGAMALAIPPMPPEGWSPPWKLPIIPFEGTALRGMQWGVAGAFTYVLFNFGIRSFRHDLTVGAAIWAIITLIAGPAIAVVLALAWHLDYQPGDSWQAPAVLFVAGLAPRRVMGIIESVALQLLKAPDEAKPNLVPLTTLRGISADLAVRLREENVEDVSALAYADPIRLVRTMPYDLRQVVNWIDQSLLALTLPEQYATLQARGVTGAIDLAWRWLQACEDPATGRAEIRHSVTVPAAFKALVREEREAAAVYEAARQMFYEEHVRLLWVMYNSFSTAIDQPEGGRVVDEGTSSKQQPETPPPPQPSNGSPVPAGAAVT